jgi:hypothetical protein
MSRALARTIAVLLAVVTVILAGGGIAALVVLHGREEHTAATAAATREQIAAQIEQFKLRRLRLEPIRSGPMDKLNQEIELMQLLADEQIALLQALSGMHADVQNLTGHPPQKPAAARKSEAPTRRGKPGQRKLLP